MAQTRHIDGNAVKTRRELAGMDARTLARKAGISESYLSRIERGMRINSRPPVIAAIARALRASVEDITTPAQDAA